MRIGSRLILNTTLIALFSVVITSAIVGWAAYYKGKQAIVEGAANHLISLRETKKEEIDRYFANMKNQIADYATDLLTIEAMNNFKNAFKNYKQEMSSKKEQYDPEIAKKFLNDFVIEFKKQNGEDQNVETKNLLNFSNESAFMLQYNYIIANNNPLEDKELLDTVDDGTSYSQFHKKYHPLIREFLKKFGFYDVFLIDSETGNVIYSSEKEVDFASNLLQGPFSNSGLAKVFKAANAAKKPGEIFIQDFSSYLPSYNEQAAFIATPIFKGDVKIGVLAFQFPIDVINNIMTYNHRWEEVGLGDTGETYLVGPDYKLRSPSRFFIESPDKYLELMKTIGVSDSVIQMMRDRNSVIGLQPVVTDGTKEVFDKHAPGFSIFKDYRDIDVLSAYAPLETKDLNWAIMSEMDADEAYQAAVYLAREIIWITLVVAFIGVFVSIIIGAKLNALISEPIENISKNVRKMATDMDLTSKIPIQSKDEVGEMASSLNQLIDSFVDVLHEALASTEKAQRAGEKLYSLAESGTLSEKEQSQIASSGKDLKDLSSKLQLLSSQFKFFEKKAEEEDEW